jgi:hypothetical protein
MAGPYPDSFSRRWLPRFSATLAAFHGSRRSSKVSGSGGIEYRDKLNRIFVDAADTPANRRFFIELKTHTKSRFEQLDIWVTVHPIELL